MTANNMNLFENPGIHSCAISIAPLKLVYRCTFKDFCRFKGIEITDRILFVNKTPAEAFTPPADEK